MSVVLEFKADGKPVLRGQSHMWAVLRKKGQGALFTSGDIDREGNDLHGANVGDFCRRLVAAGIAELSHRKQMVRGGSPHKVYKLLKTPRTLPPINRSGEPPRQHVGQQNMWNVLRFGKPTHARDLAAFASTDDVAISVSTAKSYLGHLNRGGYLILERASVSRSPAIYRLDPRRNSGPKAPMILTGKIVFDQNEGEIQGLVQAEAVT